MELDKIVDAEILFNNSVLIFSDVKYFYSMNF